MLAGGNHDSNKENINVKVTRSKINVPMQLSQRFTHVKYENPIYSSSKVMTKIKVF